MSQTLYVGNLSYETSPSDLETLFGAHGTVKRVQIISDRATGRSRGFAFVEMGTDDEAGAAMRAIDGQICDGRSLTVNEATPRKPKRDGVPLGGDRTR